jgi:hypothetical protein
MVAFNAAKFNPAQAVLECHLSRGRRAGIRVESETRSIGVLLLAKVADLEALKPSADEDESGE